MCVVAGELIRAVEELRVGQGAEHSRRRELEGALRESAAIFKRELHDKNLELAALQQQLGWAISTCILQVTRLESKLSLLNSVR